MCESEYYIRKLGVFKYVRVVKKCRNVDLENKSLIYLPFKKCSKAKNNTCILPGNIKYFVLAAKRVKALGETSRHVTRF